MTALLLFVAIIALIAGFAIPRSVTTAGGKSDVSRVKGTLIFSGIAFAIFATLWAGYYQVPAGYEGILIQQGAVSGDLDAGPHFVVPFLQTVDLMEIRTQKEEAQAAAASKDLQTVSTQVAINFHVDAKAAAVLYKSVGPTFSSRIIDPAVQETVKAIVAKYTAEQLISERAAVKAELDEGLSIRLRPWNLVIEANGVSLKDFQFSAPFNQAIEAKQVAQQTAEQAKYVLQKAEIDAQTKVTEAKGSAEANRIRAAALNANGGSKVLAQQWIEAWEKGGSQVPRVISGSGGGSFILNLSDLIGKDEQTKH